MLLFLIGIIDIGSTGSRLNIFGYTEDKYLMYHKKYEVPGGLHKLNEQDVRKNISKLTGHLKDNKSIPLGVFCTAGFRNPLNITRLKFIKSLFRGFNLKECGILSGKYEGYLGYMSLKYILNESDFVLIDMGGKSTQVVTDKSYKSYKIGHTNIKDIDKIKVKEISENKPVYISSRFTKKKNIRVDKIRNKHMRRLLKKLGVKKNLRGIKVNWTLAMSLRFLQLYTM
jgi:exopolyphosphatase/pppGpp-phosphohydrolase